ncbi:MAG TPA: peptide chain release factor N(5)-glutamine methyltransferase [Syntrophales bacterium]|nr:peptide chain release factor N(5)-glutamine methyltransferase [Syntrophales bacterium]HPO36025.1 peptide chain release factor N(5)-glutamine methyltransferase [Syntrophales bacterium]
MQLREVIRLAAQRLREAGIFTSVLDAEVLLAHVLGVQRTFLYSHPDYRLTEEEKWRYEELVNRRLGHEPIAYLVGEKEFWSRTFKVDGRVLIPRPETERLVEAALSLARGFSPQRLKIIDVGTGSGAIGITMAAELEKVWVLATDLSPEALCVARENAQRLGVREKIDFLLSSGLSAISGVFHLILSNPPYIPTGELANLPAGVRNYEPLIALDGGEDGVKLHEALIVESASRLMVGGWLLLEVGEKIAGLVGKKAWDSGNYGEVKVLHDYLGEARVVAMRKV